MNKSKLLVISFVINFLLCTFIFYYIFFKAHITESAYTELLDESNNESSAIRYSSKFFTSLMENEKIIVILNKENVKNETIIGHYKVISVPLLKPEIKKEILARNPGELKPLYNIVDFNNGSCLAFAAKCAIVDNNINLAIAIVKELQKINSSATVMVNDFDITPDVLMKDLIKFKNKKGNLDMLNLCAMTYYNDEFCSLKKEEISKKTNELLDNVSLKKRWSSK